MGASIAVAVVILLARRWRAASGPLRRALAPVLITGGFAGALLGVILIGAVPPYTSVPASAQAAARVAFAAVPLAYLLGLFRSRMDRVAVSDLVVEISRGLEPGRLRDAWPGIARPSLQLGYWLRDADGYADADGRPMRVPRRREARYYLELRAQGGRVLPSRGSKHERPDPVAVLRTPRDAHRSRLDPVADRRLISVWSRDLNVRRSGAICTTVRKSASSRSPITFAWRGIASERTGGDCAILNDTRSTIAS